MSFMRVYVCVCVSCVLFVYVSVITSVCKNQFGLCVEL